MLFGTLKYSWVAPIVCLRLESALPSSDLMTNAVSGHAQWAWIEVEEKMLGALWAGTWWSRWDRISKRKEI